MKVKPITFGDLNPHSAYDLLGWAQEHCAIIYYQADPKNKDNILFGDRSFQPFTLPPGASGTIPETNLKSFYLKALRVADKVAIGIL